VKGRTANVSSLRAKRSNPVLGAALDCFVAYAPRNDEALSRIARTQIYSPPTHARRVLRGGRESKGPHRERFVIASEAKQSSLRRRPRLLRRIRSSQ
jgi:hypothetical protein